MNDDTATPTPRPVSTLRPVKGTARFTVAAFALAAVAWVARALWHVQLAMSGMPASGPPNQGGGKHRPLSALENAYHFVSTVGDVATVLCALGFLFWLMRVQDNARALSEQPPRYGGLWLYASWIVPILNLWVPRTIVADVHRASAPDERLPRAVNWWWGLWLLGMSSSVGLMYAVSTDEVIARAYENVGPLVAVDASVVGAAVAGILVIRALTATQQPHLEAPARLGT